MKKYFILFLFSISLLAGCGFDKKGCYNEVVKHYPNSDIKVIPGNGYRYIIQTEKGKILYVETMSSISTKITFEYHIRF